MIETWKTEQMCYRQLCSGYVDLEGFLNGGPTDWALRWICEEASTFHASGNVMAWHKQNVLGALQTHTTHATCGEPKAMMRVMIRKKNTNGRCAMMTVMKRKNARPNVNVTSVVVVIVAALILIFGIQSLISATIGREPTKGCCDWILEGLDAPPPFLFSLHHTHLVASSHSQLQMPPAGWRLISFLDGAVHSLLHPGQGQD